MHILRNIDNLLILTALVALQLFAANTLAEENYVPDCTIQPNGARLTDPSSCTNFIVCLNGRPVRRACARGLYFDDRTFNCNYAALVNCRRFPQKPTTVKPDDDIVIPENQAATTTTTTPCPTTPCATTPCATTPCATTPCATTPCPTTPSATTPCVPTPCPTTPCVTTPCVTTPGSTKPCVTTPCVTTPCVPTQAPPCSSVTTIQPCDLTTTPCNTTTTNSTTTTDATKTVTVALDAHPADRRKFYITKNGKTKIGKCNKGQWFDNDTKTCRNEDQFTE